MRSIQIVEFQEPHWDLLWPILKTVFEAGETYPYSPEISEQEAYKNWIELPQQTYVAVAPDKTILGTYYIKPNQSALGAHVCNCGYIVSDDAKGKGIASQMCQHSQQIAVERGFRSMQYNLVVSTNKAAVHLWEKMGFKVVGVLPGAFNSKQHGFVDALVMYKQLV